MDEDCCPHCGSDDLEGTPAGVACAECGVMVDEYLSEGVDTEATEGDVGC